MFRKTNDNRLLDGSTTEVRRKLFYRNLFVFSIFVLV